MWKILVFSGVAAGGIYFALRAVSEANARASAAEERLSHYEKTKNSNTGDMTQLKEEIEKLRVEAQSCKDHMLQYRSLANVNEAALKQMEDSHENFKAEAEKVKKSLEDEVASLKEHVNQLQDGYNLQAKEAAESQDDRIKVLEQGSDRQRAEFDKKSTALDQHISMNDYVRILEDKKGIVKQGVDENQSENCGYFCAKAQICEKMESSADLGKGKGGKSGFDDFPSSPKSPLSPQKPFEEKDDSRNFDRDDTDPLGEKHHSKDQKFEVPTFDDWLKRLDEIGWEDPDDPLYAVALAIFYESNDHYRQAWMKMNADECANWVRLAGRSLGFEDVNMQDITNINYNNVLEAAGDNINSFNANNSVISDPENSRYYRITGVAADGRCLFRAIAHLVCLRNGEEPPGETRQKKLADQLRAQVVDELFKRRKEFEWSIEEDFETYCKRMEKPSVWGGELELLMASHVLKTRISVFMLGKGYKLRKITTYGEEYQQDKRSPIKVLFHDPPGHYEILEDIS